MATMDEKTRKALWPGSSLKHWHGEIHYRVHVWDGADLEETGFFETYEDAVEYDTDRHEAGFRTSGPTLWKGRCPTEDEIEAALTG